MMYRSHIHTHIICHIKCLYTIVHHTYHTITYDPTNAISYTLANTQLYPYTHLFRVYDRDVAGEWFTTQEGICLDLVAHLYSLISSIYRIQYGVEHMYTMSTSTLYVVYMCALSSIYRIQYGVEHMYTMSTSTLYVVYMCALNSIVYIVYNMG